MTLEGKSAYLWYLLGCAGPVLLLQAVGVWARYRGRTGEVMRAILPPALAVGAWLSFWDHFAIASGVWRFSAEKTLGVRVGAVPVEEILFFFLTSLLVALGLARLQPMEERHA